MSELSTSWASSPSGVPETQHLNCGNLDMTVIHRAFNSGVTAVDDKACPEALARGVGWFQKIDLPRPVFLRWPANLLRWVEHWLVL